MKKISIVAEDVQDHVTFSSGKQPFAALVSLSIKGEIQYTGVTQGKRPHLCPTAYPRSRATRYPTRRAPERRNVATFAKVTGLT